MILMCRKPLSLLGILLKDWIQLPSKALHPGSSSSLRRQATSCWWSPSTTTGVSMPSFRFLVRRTHRLQRRRGLMNSVHSTNVLVRSDRLFRADIKTAAAEQLS